MDGKFESVSAKIRKFGHDLSFYSVAHIIPALLALAALMLFTRVFPPGMFGRYSLVLAVAGVSSTFLYGWLDYSVRRFAPKLDQNLVMRNTSFIYIGISTVFLLIGVTGYVLASDRLGPYAIFYFAGLALALSRAGLQILLAFFRAVLDARRVTIFRLTRAVIVLAMSVVLAIVVFEHIVGWIWGTTIGITVTCILIFITSDKLQVRPLLDREITSRMFWYGVPMIGFIIGDAFLVQADRVLLGILADSVAVGIYSSNYMLVDRGLRLVYTPMIKSINPIIIDSWEDDGQQDVGSLLNQFVRYFLLLGVPAMVGIALLSETVSNLLIGEQFTDGFVIIPMVAVGMFFWAFSNIVQVVHQIKEKTALLSYGIIVIIALNLVLNVPLITWYGYIGAAVATLLSYGLYCAFVIGFSFRYLQWDFPLASLRNTVAGGALMAVPTIGLYINGSYGPAYSVVTAVVGVAIYFGVLIGVGEIGHTEMKQIQRLI